MSSTINVPATLAYILASNAMDDFECRKRAFIRDRLIECRRAEEVAVKDGRSSAMLTDDDIKKTYVGFDFPRDPSHELAQTILAAVKLLPSAPLSFEGELTLTLEDAAMLSDYLADIT